MEKRTLLAVFLIMIIYWVSMTYIWKPQPQAQNKTAPKAAQQTQNQKPTVSDSLNQTVIASLSAEQNIPVNHDILLENDYIAVRFSNVGGNITALTMKKYTQSDKKTVVQLLPKNTDLLDIKLFANNQTMDLSKMPMEFEQTKTDTTQTLTFFVKNKEGVKTFEKTITLNQDYELDMVIRANQAGSVTGYQLGFDSGINLTEDNPASVKDKPNTFKIISQISNVRKEILLRKMDKAEKPVGRIDWAAVRSKYFLYGLVPEKKIESKDLEILKVQDSPAFRMNVAFSRTVSQFDDHYKLYLGPVDYDRLMKFNNGMEEIAELGGKWIRFISKLFLQFLRLMYKVVPNYGIVILIFALLLKLLLSPLTHKTMESAKKMQEINPLMREIQQKYKNDPVRLNQELRQLYKDHKVNPMGGCLPILLQMPIFFALYPVLRYAIDLRQATFLSYLTDLSEPDPFWILPILMGVSMFLQQKMSMPKTDPEEMKKMDEKQQAAIQSQKMMLYIMPVMMFFIFKGMPSGLVLYWMVFNVLQIIQTVVQNNMQKKKALL